MMFSEQELVSVEVEQAFLGSVLLFGDVIPKVRHVRPEDFGDSAHESLWRVILTRYERGESVSPATLVGMDGCGDGQYIGKLAEAAVGRSGAEGYADHIKDLAARRSLIGVVEHAARQAADMDCLTEETVGHLLDDLQTGLRASTERHLTKRQVAESITSALSEDLPCYPTGIPELDVSLGGGLFSGKLYGVAARKKVGKTILLGSVSHNLNAAGVKHLFVPLEMSAAEIEQRNAARDLGVNSVKFLKRDDPAFPAKVAQYAVSVADNTIFEHMPGATLDQLRAMIARHVAQHGIKGVILDYWQLVQGRSGKDSEEQHLRAIADSLAVTARREGLFILTAAQVNQTGNTRGGEGLKLASDMYFTLHREKDSPDAWLEMEESRYMLYRNAGSELYPGLVLDKHGPHFRGPEV